MKYWDFTGIELGTHAFTAKIKRWQHFHISQQRYKLFFFFIFIFISRYFLFLSEKLKSTALFNPVQEENYEYLSYSKH